jgi:hypothetical protein
MRIGQPIQTTHPDFPGQTFWTTPVDWEIQRLLRGSTPPEHTLYVGSFVGTQSTVFGYKPGIEWVDLHEDSTFREADGGWRRVMGQAAETFENLELISASLEISEEDGGTNCGGH